MKFIATTSGKINSIKVEKGQLIFSTDDRVIYLDSDVRTKFDTIITLAFDSQRSSSTLVNGYYFVEETSIFWNLKDSNWTQITNAPSENIIFIDESDLPTTGKANTLYITEDVIYQWKNNEYIPMGGNATLAWEPIAE